MNKPRLLAATLAFLTIHTAYAGHHSSGPDSADMETSVPSGLPYLDFGLGFVFGEQNLAPFNDGAYDISGFRVKGSMQFTENFSLAARYETIKGDIQGIDIDTNEVRGFLNYDHEVSPGFSILGGVGYGHLQHKATLGFFDVKGEGHGVLVNGGVSYAHGPYFGSLVYTHVFTQSAKISALGVTANIEKEDIGLLEATVGYELTEQFAVTLSLESQVYGDFLIEKDWVMALGLHYSF